MSHHPPLSPATAWQPHDFTAAPLDLRSAAHLFRRAGFAANRQELSAAVEAGGQATIRRLLTPVANAAAFDAQMDSVAKLTLAAGSPVALSGWWLHRMRFTPAPLVEKTTLFWHGHFAASAAKVTDGELIYRQNQLFRRHALGSFADLVRGVSRDAAMLIYLDSKTNRKNHPNENFAREVMELFCLGLGAYTERDIQELARCFTGWELLDDQFTFNQHQHDFGAKTVLGKTGAFDGNDGLQIILDHPATARFICRKLVRFFATDDDLPDDWIAPLADTFRASRLQIAPVVEQIISSRFFFSELAIARKIRSPVELAVGWLRALESGANFVELTGKLGELGQQVFFPPNVKGWAGGRAWIDSSTLLGRANLMRALVENPSARYGGATLLQYLQRFQAHEGAPLVKFLSDLLLAAPLPEEVQRQLVQAAAAGAARPQALRQTLALFGSLPELQLC